MSQFDGDIFSLQHWHSMNVILYYCSYYQFYVLLLLLLLTDGEFERQRCPTSSVITESEHEGRSYCHSNPSMGRYLVHQMPNFTGFIGIPLSRRNNIQNIRSSIFASWPISHRWALLLLKMSSTKIPTSEIHGCVSSQRFRGPRESLIPST